MQPSQNTFRTPSGTVTITAESVTVQAPGGMRTQTVRRAQITSVQQRTTQFSVFGFGGAKQITIHTSDRGKIVLRAVKPKVAAQIMAALA